MGMKLNRLLSASLAIGMWSCANRNGAVASASIERAPVRIAVLKAELRPFSPAVSITGTLVCPTAVTVKAETTGRVLRIARQEGEAVTAGEPVVWVDDSHEQLAVRRALSDVAIAEVALERAKVMQAHSHAEWIRAQHLLTSGGITDRDYKLAEQTDREAAVQISAAVAQLEQARAQLAVTKKMLADSVVRAPVSGEIQSKITAEGAYVEPPTPVFSLTNNARLELESMIAAADLGVIRSGQRVTFRVNTFPAENFTGAVIDINPAVQSDTRAAKVRMRVENPQGKLKTGMFAQGEITTGAPRPSILIPSSAVYRDAGSSGNGRVFLVENGRARSRTVTLGAERDSLVEVVRGLAAGDMIAREQSLELADGVAVEPETQGR